MPGYFPPVGGACRALLNPGRLGWPVCGSPNWTTSYVPSSRSSTRCVRWPSTPLAGFRQVFSSDPPRGRHRACQTVPRIWPSSQRLGSWHGIRARTRAGRRPGAQAPRRFWIRSPSPEVPLLGVMLPGPGPGRRVAGDLLGLGVGLSRGSPRSRCDAPPEPHGSDAPRAAPWRAASSVARSFSPGTPRLSRSPPGRLLTPTATILIRRYASMAVAIDSDPTSQARAALRIVACHPGRRRRARSGPAPVIFWRQEQRGEWHAEYGGDADDLVRVELADPLAVPGPLSRGHARDRPAERFAELSCWPARRPAEVGHVVADEHG